MDLRRELHDLWCLLSGKCNIFLTRDDGDKLFDNDSKTSSVYQWLKEQEQAAKASSNDSPYQPTGNVLADRYRGVRDEPGL